MMSSKSWRRPSALLGLVLVAWACGAGESLGLGGAGAPTGVRATALNLSTIRLDWALPAGVTDLQLLRIERRVDLHGEFTLLAEVAPSATSYFDGSLSPETYYGYRILTVDQVGDRSRPSTVAGALTPPLPGLVLATALQGTVQGAEDPNGYRVDIRGPLDTSIAIGSVAQQTLSPLPAGTYTVTLRDVLPTCAFTAGDSVRTAVVADTGLDTRTSVGFSLSCVDPTRGRIAARVAVTGDSVDTDGYRIDYVGLVTGDSLPALGGAAVNGFGGVQGFGNLLPGDYEVTISDVEAPCLLSGVASRSVQVAPLSADTVSFAVTCPTKGGGNPNAPFILRNVWTPSQAGAGQTVTLDVSLDLSAVSGQDVGAVQASLQYNTAVLTYVSATAPAPALMNNLTVNTGTPGTITWLNFSTGSTPPTGVVPVARFSFTVTGSTGQTASTQSSIATIGNFDGSQTLETQFRVVEDTFVVGAGSGGGNQNPVAQAGGPYSGSAGNAISFCAAGSGDPDGSIANYGWAFGDGTTSTQANPAKVYATAGTYTATLTVTDNQGATATDQATVTVTGGGGGGAQPFTYRNVFTPPAASSGQTVTLDISLDASAVPSQNVGAVQAITRFNPAVLQYVSSSAPAPAQMNNLTVSTGTPGQISWLNFTTSATPSTGLVSAARFTFTVIGSGSSVTSTTIAAIADAAGSVTLDTLFRVVEDTFAAGSGGSNQSPVAQAGGPYTGTAGQAIGFSSAGSSDPDGSIASYSWVFGDGTTSTQASPSKSYAAAGSYTVTLTVTDNQGATATAQAAVTVSAAATPVTWTSTFGGFNAGLAAYPLVVTLNLTQDIPQTSGPEALGSYVVDSLVWDPAVLEYHSLVFASGGGSSNITNATGGCKCKLSFTGVALSPNTGLVPVATVNFRPKGTSGSTATPRFYLGSVLSTAALGSFNYLGVLQRVEGSLTLP